MPYLLIGYACLLHVIFWGIRLGSFESFAFYIVLTITHVPASLLLEDPLNEMVTSFGWAIGSRAHVWLFHGACMAVNLLMLWVGTILFRAAATYIRGT